MKPLPLVHPSLLLCLASFLGGLILVSPRPLLAQEEAVAEPEASAADKEESAAGKAKPKLKIKVATIEVTGILAEGPSSDDLFGQNEPKLSKMLARLQKAAEDQKVKSVILRLRGAAMGRGTLHELRRGIHDLKASGKPVIASLEMGLLSDYLLACACDRITMPESGSLILPGIRAELTFYKNLFAKLDIEPDMIQVGDFKGAAEPYMREKMSDEFRRQFSVVLDDFYAQMVETIARERGLSQQRVEQLIDEGMFSAEEALTAGLIDEVAYEADWRDELLGGSDQHELELVEDYAEKKVDTDFSGMAGLVKLLDLFSGGDSRAKRSKRQKIAVVYALGVIMPGESSNSLLSGSTMGSDTMIEALREASEDETVAAIVLRVDSPGGSALASDLIWNEIQRIEKPVVASMGNVAASGGYYISMSCDQIFAEPGTLTGSIGVVGGKLAMGGLLEKLGVTTDVISRGKHSGMFSINEKFTPSERAVVQRSMEEVYRQFTEKAAAGRNMEREELLKLAGGRVWTGRQALENGLVDQLGTLDDAVKAAQQLGGMDAEDDPERMILPEPKSVFEELFGTSVQAPQVDFVPEPLRRRIQRLKTLESLLSEPSLTVLPYDFQLQ